MVIVSILPHWEFGPNGHRKDTPDFNCYGPTYEWNITYESPNDDENTFLSWTYLFLILGPFCLFMTCCQCYVRSVTDLNGYLIKVAENAEQRLDEGREQCAKARGWYR